MPPPDVRRPSQQTGTPPPPPTHPIPCLVAERDVMEMQGGRPTPMPHQHSRGSKPSIERLCTLAGERGVAQLRAGPDQLPEQVQADPWLGRPFHQGQGAHQQCLRHETVAVLQGNPFVLLSYLGCVVTSLLHQLKIINTRFSACGVLVYLVLLVTCSLR